MGEIESRTQVKRSPGRPKGSTNKVKPVDHTVAELDESKPGRMAQTVPTGEAALPVTQEANDANMSGRRVRPRSGQNITDPAVHEGSKPNKLQEALGRKPVVYYMGGGAIQIKPTNSTIVTLNTGEFAKNTVHGRWLRRANPTQPFSHPLDPVDDADFIEMIEEYRKNNALLCKKVGCELYPWDGGKLAPPMDRWDSLNAEAIKRVLLAGAADPVKCLRYEMQRPVKRQDVIDAIEEANLEIEAAAEAESVQQEIEQAREREASVGAVAV